MENKELCHSSICDGQVMDKDRVKVVADVGKHGGGTDRAPADQLKHPKSSSLDPPLPPTQLPFLASWSSRITSRNDNFPSIHLLTHSRPRLISQIW